MITHADSDDVIIRWTFGETTARPTSPQAINMLRTSVKLAKRLFPSASLFICHNNLSLEMAKKVLSIGRRNGVELIDVTRMLPKNLRKCQKKNSWWKYALPRMDHNRYEILVDNDVVLWKIPPTVLRGIRDGALVALTDAGGRFYGDLSDKIREADPELTLNAGLLGMPPGFCPNFDLLEGVTLRDWFHSEQGFTAMNFILHQGPKYLVPLDEVQQLNIHRIPPEELLSSYSGGHFCGCLYGHYDFWEKSYGPIVRRKYLEVPAYALFDDRHS